MRWRALKALVIVLFAADAEGVATNVRRAVATGLAGLSIEDFAGDDQWPPYRSRGASTDLPMPRPARNSIRFSPHTGLPRVAAE